MIHVNGLKYAYVGHFVEKSMQSGKEMTRTSKGVPRTGKELPQMGKEGSQTGRKGPKREEMRPEWTEWDGWALHRFKREG